MSGNIIDLFVKKTIEELREYCQAQYDVINKLTKQVEQLKEEKKHVEELLKTATPTIFQEEDVSDDEKIARTQLRVLEGTSRDRELTAEESRKVETYHKILNSIKNQNKKQTSPVDNMPIGDLLKLVKDDEAKNP